MITNDTRVFSDTVKAAYGGAWPSIVSKVGEDRGDTLLIDVTILPVDSGDTGLCTVVPVTLEEAVYQIAATTTIDLDALTEQQVNDLILKHAVRPVDLMVRLFKRFDLLSDSARSYLVRRFGAHVDTMRRLAKERE